ncbi:MAG: M67 family metallopeptidase [Vicinamibacteraceae bacterium]
MSMSHVETRDVEPRLCVARQVVERITDHARREWPNECCGLLLGTDERIDEAVPARNLHASSSRFLVDPVDHLAAVRRARATARRIVGAYHSHPRTPPVPSARDLEEATYTEFVYMICGPVRPADRDPVPLRAWRLVNERPASFAEVPFVVVG